MDRDQVKYGWTMFAAMDQKRILSSVIIEAGEVTVVLTERIYLLNVCQLMSQPMPPL